MKFHEIWYLQFGAAKWNNVRISFFFSTNIDSSVAFNKELQNHVQLMRESFKNFHIRVAYHLLHHELQNFEISGSSNLEINFC